MNAVVEAWGFWGFHAAWQAAVVAAVILAVVRLGRRWPAPIRYGLLLVALAKFALPPIVSLPMSPFSYCGPEVARVEQETAAPVVHEPQPIPTEPPAATFEMPEYEAAQPELAPMPMEPADMPLASSLPPITPQKRPWNWKLALLSIHVSSMALVAGWLAVQWLRLRQLQRSARETSDEQIRQRFAILVQQLGLRRSVRLLIGPNDTVPCSFGLLRPVVVVPNTLIAEPSEDLDRVLAHELAHHRRGDLWVNVAQLGLFIVWWFNPLYWLLHRSLRTVREDCCDDLLLAKGIASPGDYCDTILRVASDQKSTGPLAIASSMADYPHPLEKRFRRIMDGSLRRSVRLGWLGLTAVVVLAAVLLPGARGLAEPEKEALPEAEVKQAESVDEVPEPEETKSNDTPRLGEPRTVVGRVVDESGEPVAGAKIWLPIYDSTATAKTDDRGFFRLEVPTELLRLRMLHRQFTHVWAYAPDYSVGIASAYDALFDEQGEPMLLQLATESQTAITVVTPDGSPAAGATVEPYRCLATTTSMLVPDELAAILRTTTDESGCTQLSAIVPHSTGSLAITTEQSGCQLIQPDADRLGNEPWRIELRPVGKVVGQIACDDFESVAGVRLALRTYGDPKPPYTTIPPHVTEGYARVLTDDQGRFTVEHMAVGRLRLYGTLANEGRSRLWIPDWYHVTEGDATDVKLEARVGVPVTGTVVEEETKRPIQGAHVRLSPYGRTQGTYATTDEHGRYSTYAVPGTTGYSATAPNYRRSSNDSLYASIELPKDASLFEMPAIHLAPVDMPRAIRGRLIDDLGRSVPHARVTAYRGDTTHGQRVGSGSTDARGLLRLAGVHLDEELAKLTFYVEEFFPQPVPADLIQEDPLVLQVVPLSKQTGTRITGRVIDQRGEPVEGAVFYLEARPDETDLRNTVVRFSHDRPLLRTDEAGRFQTPEFYRREWQYRITVESPPRQSAYGTSQWIAATDSTTDLGDIKVNRSFSVRGRVVDESGNPIRGATVTLPREEDTIHAETTDAEGRFAFKTVFGYGRYQFKIVADGYQTYEERTPFSKEDREKTDGGPTIVLQRKAGGAANSRNEDSPETSSGPAEREAPRKESSSPQMLPEEIPRLGNPRTIQGRVVDESGTAVAGAKIWLPVQWHPGPLVTKGTTDEQGHFQLEVPGEWLSEQDSHRRFHTAWAYAPGYRIAIADAQKALSGEASEPLELVLGEEMKTSVMVLKPDGSLAKGATVEPYARTTTIIPGDLASILRTTTDENGLARLPLLPLNGHRSLAIEALGFGRQHARIAPSGVGDESPRVILRPTGRVVGRVVADDAKSAAGIRLSLMTQEDPHANMPPWINEGCSLVVTDGEGRFEVEHLATGRLTIHGTLSSQKPERLRIPGRVRVEMGRTSELTLTVEPSVLVTGSIIEQGTRRPIAGAELAVRYGEAAQGERATTDQDGRFSARVLPGEVSVSVGSIPGNYMQPKQSPETTIQVPADTEQFELPPTEIVPYQVLSGRLINHQGKPVPDVQVRTVWPGSKSSAQTDHAGRFELERLPLDAAPENLIFQVTEVRHRPLSVKVAKSAPLLLQMEPLLTPDTGTIVSGRIIDKLGIPVADARVTLEEREDENDLGKLSGRLGYPPETTTTDQDGRFEFPELLDRNRQYRVTVAPKSLNHLCRGNSKWITATGPATSMGEFVVDRVWSARGQVVDEDGKPIAGATVTYDREEASPIVVQTNANGRFAFRGVFSDFYSERFPWPNVVQFGPCPLRIEAKGYQAYDEPTYIQDAKIERADAGVRVVLVRQKPPTALELLQGVERVRTTFPSPILVEIETHYEDKRLRKVQRNRVIFDGNRYRFQGINDDRVNPCSIFDGTTALHYDGTNSCTIQPPSDWTADYLFDPKTLGLTTLLRPGRDVAACLAYRDAKQILLVGKETMGTERRVVGDTWHVRVLGKHDQRLDFWIELPNYWVTKFECRFNDTYRVADSQWSDPGVFPDKVAIKRYSSNRLVSETTLKTLRMLELLELPPGIWTLAGLDLPVGTPVVKLNAGRQGYWNGKEVVPSLSESTPK
jgi:beta-lactamase regulating signal transducer with metallopeptidase domain/protocatechuate 3,4-dioxygenase beta subunit